MRVTPGESAMTPKYELALPVAWVAQLPTAWFPLVDFKAEVKVQLTKYSSSFYIINFMQGYSVLSPLDISLLLVLVGAALLELCDKVSGKDGGGGPGGRGGEVRCGACSQKLCLAHPCVLSCSIIYYRHMCSS